MQKETSVWWMNGTSEWKFMDHLDQRAHETRHKRRHWSSRGIFWVEPQWKIKSAGSRKVKLHFIPFTTVHKRALVEQTAAKHDAPPIFHGSTRATLQPEAPQRPGHMTSKTDTLSLCFQRFVHLSFFKYILSRFFARLKIMEQASLANDSSVR